MGKIISPFLYMVLWILGWLYYLQPRLVRSFMGWMLGMVLRSLSMRSEVIRENLSYAYPHHSASEATKALFNQAYIHLGNLVLEIFLLFGPMKFFVRKHCRIKGLDYWRDAKSKGRGVIFLSSHVGNWEIMAAAGALLGGVDILLVTKRLKPEWFHKIVEKSRTGCGVSGTYEPRTYRDVISHLRNNGTVGIVIDQYAGPPVGVRVPFFGVPVSTHTIVAALAKRTGALVLPVVSYWDAGGCFIIDMMPPLDWVSSEDRAYEIAANTAAYAKEIERHIYMYPDQWIWTHKRFKGDLSPLGKDEWCRGRSRGDG
ncbi:MAG: lysophospholipid acyltransferase family protein [Bdellovibrionota bacterium]